MLLHLLLKRIPKTIKRPELRVTKIFFKLKKKSSERISNCEIRNLMQKPFYPKNG